MKGRFSLALGCAGALLALIYSYAYAQTIPRSVEADTLGKQAQAPPQPSLPPLIEGAPSMAVEVPKGAENVHLTPKQIVIEGSSVYTPEQLREYYAEFVGTDATLADMYVVAARITRRYLAEGYIITKAFLPPQRIADGTVHIQVIEGYIRHVRWLGDVPDSGIMLDMADQLLDIHPLNGQVLESTILKLNDLAGLQVQATMTPDGEEAGAVDVVLKVDRKRIAATASLNDYASRYLGIWQESAQTDLHGLVSPVDKLSLNALSSTETMFSRYEQVEYSIPISADGTVLLVGGSKSHNAPGFTLTPLQIRSNADYAWFGVSQPVLRSREESLTVTSKLNLHDIKTDILATRLSEDRIRTLQLSGAYNRADRWGGSNLINIDLFKGLNILNATPDGASGLSRANGHSAFFKAVLNASRLQTIDQKFSLLFAATGQMANAPLLSSEQFSYGGMPFGRAYDPAEINGDEGAAASLELRYDAALSDQVTLQPYFFYDIGKVWNRTTPNAAMSGASAGPGLRCQLWHVAQVDFSLAKPLTLPTAVPKLGARLNEPRANVSIQLTF